jgi:glycine/D-amino acid oxidase-like deaminating enzyme
MRVVVVGAGVLGASAVFQLAKADAAVVDADLDGRANAAGAAMICP